MRKIYYLYLKNIIFFYLFTHLSVFHTKLEYERHHTHVHADDKTKKQKEKIKRMKKEKNPKLSILSVN